MKTSDFHYYLPERLIAQEPVSERHLSRLMVLDKKTGEIQHRHFFEVPEFFSPGDCLVLNDTRVIPARLIGNREGTGGRMEFLLIKPKGKNTWEIMAKPGSKALPGNRFIFGGGMLKAEITGITADGYRSAVFEYDGDFDTILHRIGIVPLPPYIKKEIDDPERYQTIYAYRNGSVAAPTAGLHLTSELMAGIASRGVTFAALTLHVGPGTFRPVETESVEDHKMHTEYYIIDQKACDAINKARSSGHRVVAVGTTSCRTLETVADEEGHVRPGSGWTDIFIYPGYAFKAVDMLITNFHLPGSTLVMLVSAFAGPDNVKRAYEAAIKNEYRFYSFGDAMLIK